MLCARVFLVSALVAIVGTTSATPALLRGVVNDPERGRAQGEEGGGPDLPPLPPPPPTVIVPCSTNDDCEDGSCENGVCVTPPATVPPGRRRELTNDFNESVPAPPPAESIENYLCDTNDDCEEESFCTDGVCVATPPGATPEGPSRRYRQLNTDVQESLAPSASPPMTAFIEPYLCDTDNDCAVNSLLLGWYLHRRGGL
jgi:hypothetical protein